ncbi:PREDICTED: defensin-like protein 194 [Camelina sativa]|uniref:Defensin-like protein 194 n=1 Tax=Camelina sativa TaxID=90675 RepID=A0ABM0YZR4_CAMSA|nr:PREDICTED: defensin-like protein 194 [Camelina sativa]
MAMATKLVSSFAIFFILVLVISGMPKTEARDDDDCVKEYTDSPPIYCMARIYPSLCYYRCISDKGAKGGKCDADLKCFCNFCSDKPSYQFLSNV